MRVFIDILIILPLLVLCYQLYSFSAKSEGLVKQERCQKLGIMFMTLGILALVFRSAPWAFFGLVLIMSSFRLLAKGLDRLDKKTFIDQLDEDR
ncbi:MAG: hypothetical protein IPQ16_03485 [Geobacteraceae bacterium]|nr:hypothetical protein [Geobacteraceae bacterium]